MVLSKDKIKEVIKNHKVKSADDFNNLIKEMSKEFIETLLEGEMTDFLGYSKYDQSNKKTNNSRNGKTSKKVISKNGELEITVPRDRESEFEPGLVKKREKDISGFQDKIISMYARNMSTRDIQDHLEDIYGYEFSPDFISTVTNKVLDKAKEWQSRPLKEIYPIVFLDALVLKIRKDGHVKNVAVYGVLGINLEGKKECLGLWMGENESSKFWLGVLNELKNRGVKYISIFSVDNLSGISESITAAYPDAEIQKCIVHQIKNSVAYVSWKERKAVCGDLKNIYKAHTEESGLSGLKDFKEKWNKKYPHISMSWERNWNELSTFYKYPEEIRKLIYTTNPIESFNSLLKKNTKTRGSFPNEDSAFKLLFLGVEKMEKKWNTQIKDWGLIYSQLKVYFEDKFKKYIEK